MKIFKLGKIAIITIFLVNSLEGKADQIDFKCTAENIKEFDNIINIVKFRSEQIRGILNSNKSDIVSLYNYMLELGKAVISKKVSRYYFTDEQSKNAAIQYVKSLVELNNSITNLTAKSAYLVGAINGNGSLAFIDQVYAKSINLSSDIRRTCIAFFTKQVSYATLAQNLQELSGVVSGNIHDQTEWSRARLVRTLGDDLENRFKSSNFEANIFLLYVMNNFVNSLTSEIIEKGYKSKYLEAIENVKKSGAASITQIQPSPLIIDFAIEIMKKTLFTIMSNTSSDVVRVEIQDEITALAIVASSTPEMRAKAFYVFSENLLNHRIKTQDGTDNVDESRLVNIIKANERTAPEAMIIATIIGWARL